MSPDETRAADLATTSLQHFRENRRDDAVRLLREALSLAPKNPIVLATFHALQEDANLPPITKLLQKCTLEGDETAGNDALRLLKDPNASLRTDTAVECLQLLESHIDAVPASILGKLAGEILRVSRGAREYVATRLAADSTAVLQMFEKLGEEAIDGIASVLLDPTVWKADENTKALRDSFRWFLTRLKGNETACIARSVARLLANKAEDLHGYVNQSGLEQLLTLLDLNAARDLRSHATLATAKFVETSGDVGQSMIAKFMGAKLASDADEDLRLAFSVAAAIFPLVPQVAAGLFMTDGFVDGLVPSLQARPVDVEAAALEMLNAACVDKTCRAAIAGHCSEFLEAMVKSGDKGKTTAAVVLAKVKYSPGEGKEVKQRDMDKLAKVFKGMMLKDDDAEARDSSVEGLAYTSLKGSVKEMLIHDAAFVKGLITTLETSAGKPTVMFGALTVVSNLTAYPPTLSGEQRKVAELKNYAETKPKACIDPDPEDTDAAVTPRCAILLAAGIIPALVACSRKITPTAIAVIASIILSLSKQQKHRGPIAAQGAVKLLLQFFSAAENPTVAHALARILVSVNPSHVFSSALAISSAIRPLLTILDSSEDAKDLLPVFEALLALTNLASTGEDVCDAIIRRAWTKVEDLLLSSNQMVQRATVELVCNLMASPAGVAKFADGSGAASNRMHILLALADAEDVPTRRAAGGALAMLTEWDKAAEAVVQRERGVKIVLDMVRDDNTEIRHRGVVVIRNLVCGEKAYGEEVKKDGGLEVLKEAMRKTREPEVLEVGVEALKALMEG